ncbi:phosphatase PAP2 family protein [Cohnella sp. LGH]|uniref:PAP2 superfamily protein n=1 Tax=Cohnella phaseoli TaxID=456490 RepID=A0A3D9I1Q3_9BACL|nr:MULTISPECIES: phosphatase PAP2 family protein [Cohnella]QTH41772.1 phosphatase PAP2 family protein [Cohnella sp. LGH]RED55601.1 PAP2 superfamily protein [Cohnella phaseoli]
MNLKSMNWRKYSPLLLMLMFPVLGWMYALTNNIENQEVYSLAMAADEAIPYLKWFALPYSVWIFYIYVCLFYFFKKDISVYYRNLMTYAICALLCYLIYSVFQTTVARPPVIGDDPFSWLMRYIYNRDQPYNCFPSIHCFSSYMVMRAIWTSSFRNKWNLTLITGMSSLIIMSTLFVKQHVIMDVLGAIFVVEVVTAAIILVERKAKLARERQKGTFGA